MKSTAHSESVPANRLRAALLLKQPDALRRQPIPERFALLPAAELARVVGDTAVRTALVDFGVQTDNDVRQVLTETKRAFRRRHDRFGLAREYAKFWSDDFPTKDWPVLDLPHDVTLTQAFGRNGISDKELGAIAQARQQSESGVEVFDGPLRKIGFDPGDSNRALAEVVAEQLEDRAANIEQVAQWEVVHALYTEHPETYHEHQDEIHALWPRDGFYPTYMVKQDSLALMRERGLYNPFELAYPGMMVRSLGILARLGVEADPLSVEVPFDGDSVQWQTQNRRNWIIREFLTRGEHLLRDRVNLL